MSLNKRNILITMGDPSGVGPEVVLKALSDKVISRLGHITVIGDFFIIDKIRKSLKLKTEFSLKDLSNVPSRNFTFGRQDPAFGRAAIEYIDKALEMIKHGEADALVTAPLNKKSVKESGLQGFEGHTEYLAAKTATKDFVMMFAGGKLKVSLVTRHVALKDVPKILTTELVYKTIMITADNLKKYFGIAEPRIGVAGLNPHAGEGGLFGDEEAKIIAPAVKRAADELNSVLGPMSADAIFYEALNGKFDAVVAMYHDQALAPFKLLHFKDGVNLTLGLPFIRTSPDHGTAFDIAGKGIADATSMKEAIALACRLKGVRPLLDRGLTPLC